MRRDSVRTLVLYGTKHGCTERCANELAGKLEGEIVVHNIKNGPVKNLNAFDKVIIGSSVYAGMIRKEVKSFCQKNKELLNSKITGYFICGLSEGEEATKLLDAAYDEELLSHAVVKGSFGGEIVLDKMGFFEKAVIKKVAKVEKDQKNISQDAINHFALMINNA